MLCTDEDGVIDMDAVNRIDCTFHERALASIAVIKTMALEVATLALQRDSVSAEYEAAIKRIEANSARLKANLMDAMKGTETSVIKSPDGLLTAKFYAGRDVSVQLDDDAVFDLALCNKPKAPTPSKALINAALMAGEVVAGARIVKSDRLEVK